MRFPLRTVKGYGMLVSALLDSCADDLHPYLSIVRCLWKAKTKKEFIALCAAEHGLKTTYRKVVSRLFPTLFPKEQDRFSDAERLDNYAALCRRVAIKTLADESKTARTILINSVDYAPEEYSDSRHRCGPINEDLIEDVKKDKKLRKIMRDLVLSSISPTPWKTHLSLVNRLVDRERLAVGLVLAMRDAPVSNVHWFPLLVDLPYNCRIGWAISQLYPECRLTLASAFKIICWNNLPRLIDSLDLSSLYACSALDRCLPSRSDAGFPIIFRRTIASSVLCRRRQLLIEKSLERGLFETAARLGYHFIDILSKDAARLLSECSQTRPIGELALKISNWLGDRGVSPLEGAPIGLLGLEKQDDERDR